MSSAPADTTPALASADADAPPRFARYYNRLIALPLFLAGSTVLGLAAMLTPRAEGIGTHRQLGLPPCQFEQVTGMPCATCGCTTSFSHAANGSLLDAFITQPFGALLAVLTAMTVLITGYALVTDMQVVPILRVVTRGKVIILMLVIMMAAWAYTIAKHVG